MSLLRPGRLFSPWRWMQRVAVLVVMAYAVGSVGQVWWTANHDGAESAGAIIVLGAAQYNGRPSPVLAARLDHGLELYRRGLAKVVVVTGGRKPGDRTTQAAVGAGYLRKRGVPDSRIRLEVDGTNTWEELSAVSRFLRREGITSVVIVTDGYHAARARATAEEAGLAAVASPVPGTAPWERILPEAAAFGIGRFIGFRRLSIVV